MICARALVIGLLIAGTTLGAAPDANAVTRAAAARIAVRVLHPPAGGNVVVFGLPRPVAKGSYVFEHDPGVTGRRTVRVRPLSSAAWLFWEDRDYGAKFEHPSRLLLLDARSGRRLTLRRMRWWPLVNGRRLAFDDAPGYFDPRLQVFSGGTRPAAAARARAAAEPAPKPIAVPGNAFKDDCVIDIGRDGDARTAPDFKRLDSLMKRLKNARTGIQDFAADSRDTVPKDPTTGRPARPENAADGDDLKRDVDILVKRRDCKDVFIYIDGHGAETGVARVQVGGRNWKPRGRPNADGSRSFSGDSALVTADDLRDILKAHPQTTFKIKIDACFAGRFLLDLTKQEFPNLLILEASSGAQETSLFALPERTVTGPDSKRRRIVSPTNNPGNAVVERPDPDHPGKKIRVWDRENGLSEFSNGNFSAFETFITDPALVATAQAKGGSLLARALEHAAAHSGEQDFAAQQGLTHPKTQVNIPGAGPTPAPVPAPSKAADCEQPLTATLTTPASGPGAGMLHVQITGQCLALLPRLRKLRVSSPAGKLISGWDAHSTGCVPDPATGYAGSITCVVKPDGRVCTLLDLLPDVAPGDILHIQLLGEGDVVLDELDLVVPAGGQPACPVTG